MTEYPRSARRHAGLVTTAIVSVGTAVAIGWAAAVPVGGSTSTGAAQAASAGSVQATQTAQQIDNARANLQQVRHDLRRILSREDDLPRAKLANLPALAAPVSRVPVPSVQVPQSTTPPTVTVVTPPATHTTTGASGAGP